MGFCLLEDAEREDVLFAVNPAHVVDLKEQKGGDVVFCDLEFSRPLVRGDQHFLLKAKGAEDDIWTLLQKSAKIGLDKAKLNLMAKLSANPMPLLINQPGRIIAVYELMPEDFMAENQSVFTASALFFEDGSIRFISERPAKFVYQTNAGHVMPTLKME